MPICANAIGVLLARNPKCTATLNRTASAKEPPAAAVAHRLGLCDSEITVTMPGGNLALSFADSFEATMTGPVTPVCTGTLLPSVFAD